ncbi:MAG: hypothetical protein A2Y62_03555 [Candidatus Fischerbacteria bacterium RBG_13_37_8]|uniref:Sulfatase N-terminal domain-containing protein n=1 Tax=Candidatus Fischerbacteria bacterium RBG_13_37_8 TaxID=1817863 RepID=A0A1F5V7X7_9BACT|nr:MAG: hypothetical protein A2Y62_03555 [Candidatus Fischerbacteria bacterium RBG_13_37_8]
MKNKIATLAIIFIILLCGMKVFSRYYAKKSVNVLIITVDMLRADRMGIYGYERNTTPVLDAFAKENMLFKKAFSQASWTPPSLATIFSGSYPTEHGISDWNSLANPKVKFLVDRLPKNYYQTAFITNHPSLLLDNLGFTKGYDKRIVLKSNDDRASKITRLSIEWLQKAVKRKKPFILWTHYFDAHEPFTPSEPFKTNFLTQYLGELPNENVSVCEEENYYGLNCLAPYIVEKGNTNLNYYSLLYDAEIAEVDSAIGELIESVKKLKLMENTIIVITSDHGEIIKRCEIQQDKCIYMSHGTFLFHELIRVPLILHVPGQKGGITVPDNVATIDVLPTLSYLTDTIANEKFRGLSLLPINKINKYRKIYTYETRLNTIASVYRDWEFIKYDTYSEFYKFNNFSDEIVLFPNENEPATSRLIGILENSVRGRLSTKYFEEIKLSDPYVEKLNSLGYAGSLKINLQK